jgi:four helix bundle protein
MGKFKELRVWQDAMNLCTEMYKLTARPPFNRDFGLCDQLRRASVSIPSNIAEGDERGTSQQAIYHLHVAKGSTAEVITQLNIAHRIGYLGDTSLAELENQADKILASLKNLIKAKTNNP